MATVEWSPLRMGTDAEDVASSPRFRQSAIVRSGDTDVARSVPACMEEC
jgi:hypothetical protein